MIKVFISLFVVSVAFGSGVSRRQPDHWDNTTNYAESAVRYYSRTTTTDANGRITVTTTETGGSSGTPLFSGILTADGSCFDASNNATQTAWATVETQTVSQTVFRMVRGSSQGVLIGGTISNPVYAGSGYTCRVNIKGLR